MLPVFQYFTLKLKCKADCDLKEIYFNKPDVCMVILGEKYYLSRFFFNYFIHVENMFVYIYVILYTFLNTVCMAHYL